MKLIELFNTNISNRKVSKHFDNEKISNNSLKRNATDNMSGSFGYVKKSGDPHVINKRPHEAADLNDDAYYVYIKTVVEKKIAESNSFFPRVYDIKTFTDPDDNAKYSIKLEKLIDLADTSEDEFKHLLNNIFKNLNELYNSIKNSITGRDLSQREIYYRIIDINLRKIETLKNAKLIEAINFITQIKNSNPKFAWDLHSSNVMVRRGPYGIQLVITDPLA